MRLSFMWVYNTVALHWLRWEVSCPTQGLQAVSSVPTAWAPCVCAGCLACLLTKKHSCHSHQLGWTSSKLAGWFSKMTHFPCADKGEEGGGRNHHCNCFFNKLEAAKIGKVGTIKCNMTSMLRRVLELWSVLSESWETKTTRLWPY